MALWEENCLWTLLVQIVSTAEIGTMGTIEFVYDFNKTYWFRLEDKIYSC